MGSCQREFTSLGHGINGIEDEIYDALLNLVVVTSDQRQSLLERTLQTDVRKPQFVSTEHQAFLNQFVDRHIAKLQLRLTGEGQQVGDDLGTSVGLIFHEVQIIRKLLLVVCGERSLSHNLEHKPGIVQNTGQGIVDLVNNTSRQPT